MLIPKQPDIGNWKLNVAKNQGSIPKPKVMFDMLFDKYSKQKAVTRDQLHIKRGRHRIPGQLSGLEVNHLRGSTLLQIGILQVQIRSVLSMMTMG
jgi:hypothetical protein